MANLLKTMMRRRPSSQTSDPGEGGNGDGADIGAKVAVLMAKRSRAQADLDRLEASGETQLLA